MADFLKYLTFFCIIMMLCCVYFIGEAKDNKEVNDFTLAIFGWLFSAVISFILFLIANNLTH